MGLAFSSLEHNFRFVGRTFVLLARSAKTENRLDFGFSNRFSASGFNLARAAVLEFGSGLPASANRPVVRRETNQANETRMAEGLSFLPGFDSGVSFNFVAGFI